MILARFQTQQNLIEKLIVKYVLPILKLRKQESIKNLKIPERILSLF